MKKIKRNPEKFESVRLLDAISRSTGLKFSDPINYESLLSSLVGAVSKAPLDKTLMQGLRIESMFAYVAGALGHCLAVKEEDSGELYSQNRDVIMPDFRLITRGRDEFLVEVKSCRKAHPNDRYRFSSAYFRKLRAYADLFKV